MAKPNKSKMFSVRTDASERILSDGRVLVRGEPVSLDEDEQNDPHNKRLIEEGQVIEVKDQSQGGGE